MYCTVIYLAPPHGLPRTRWYFCMFSGLGTLLENNALYRFYVQARNIPVISQSWRVFCNRPLNKFPHLWFLCHHCVIFSRFLHIILMDQAMLIQHRAIQGPVIICELFFYRDSFCRDNPVASVFSTSSPSLQHLDYFKFTNSIYGQQQ